MAPAGVSSKGLSRDKHGPGNACASAPDLSMLYMSEGPRPESKREPGFNSRVDPGVFKGAAGSTSEQFTYSMVNPEDWEFMPKEGTVKATKKERDDERCPCKIAIKTRNRGQGECRKCPKSDPITHFKHEGLVFKDPWRPTKRSGYGNAAAKQTWTWQQGNDNCNRQLGKERVGKHQMDCRGKMHYLSGGEEDLIPAAINTFIKSDMRPTAGHVLHNDKTQLSWCHRLDPSPRVKEKLPNYHSEQVWDCMVHQKTTRPGVANTSTQCSLRGSESAVVTPPRASRGILTLTDPQIGVNRQSSDADFVPFYAVDPLDSAPSMTMPSTTTENMPPRQSEPPESRGSRESRSSMGRSGSMTQLEKRMSNLEARMAATGARGDQAIASSRGSREPKAIASSRGSREPKAVTPRGTSAPAKRPARSSSLPGSARGPISNQEQGFPYNPARTLSSTLRGSELRLFNGNASRASLSETQVDSTPRARQSGSVTPSSAKPAWK